MPVEALFDIAEPGESRVKDACLVSEPSRVVGIDLGTTNSLVAMVQGGQPVCLRDETTIVPSVVHYAADGRVVVGQVARDLAATHPTDTIASIKRFMGRGPQDAEATRRLTPYRFAAGSEGDTVVRLAVAGGRAVTPVEVSAEILRVLRVRAEAALGGPVEGAVITVPAYFDDGQRQATRDAGRLAGLEVLRLLNEPTAAALAYGLDKQVEGTFAVFDLGGGTFDISILQLERGVFEVKATGGDSALGGDDFDRAIAAHLLAAMGVAGDAGGDRFLTRRVLDAARAAKEALSDAAEVPVTVARSDGTTWAGRLTRGEVEALVRPVLERCAPAVRRALADAGVPASGLAGVILVGGATRMPLVRSFVRGLFEREPLADIDPDEVVALGAAIQADLLARGGRDDVVLMDVVPLSLGLEMMGGVAEKLIHRNTTVPCGASQTFTTYADRQTGFDLHVVQGERELVADCRSLARFKLTGLPPLPAGMARLEVTFLVDADGILRVSAHGEADIKARQLAEQRVEAERILAATRAALETTPALATAEDRAAIDGAARGLEQAMAGEDHLAIRAAVEALDAASKPFAQRRMDRALAEGLRGRGISEVEHKIDEVSLRTPPADARRS
jgi:molecular chaperone HscA